MKRESTLMTQRQWGKMLDERIKITRIMGGESTGNHSGGGRNDF